MRLIDADALQKEYMYEYDGKRLMLIDTAPTIEERKKGRWVMDENPHDGDCRCSSCGIAIDAMHERHHGLLNALTNGKWWMFYHFCPRCGARMEAKDE